MPHMERITWSGVALHGGALPGYPASHGCVRMPYKFAERLFGLTKVGMRVIIARDDVAPVPISHPLLFKRTPYRDGAGLVTKAAALVGNMLGRAAKPGNEPADVRRAGRCTAGDHDSQDRGSGRHRQGGGACARLRPRSSSPT